MAAHDADRPARSAVAPWLAYAAAWVPVVAVFALLIAGQRADTSMTVASALVASVLSVLPAALLGVVVWHLTGRIHPAARGRGAFIAVHVGLAFLYGALWDVILIVQMLVATPREYAREFIDDAAGWQLLTGMMLYGLLAGTSYALRGARRSREQEARAAAAEVQRARAELRALRAQLDPHFLFNTLHSVTALVRSDPAMVEDALERFGRLLRYVLDANVATGDDVSLADEWEFVRDYLALERLRFGERLRVVEDVDPDALDCAVPVLTLQPLVENALRHGIGTRADGGTLHLAAHLDGEVLTLVVQDDGRGADRWSSVGVGLRAVRERLEVRYPGGRAALAIDTAPGSGWLARVTLPAEPAPLRVSPRRAAPLVLEAR
jgi:sensor histidine kinase YesM